MKSFHSFAALMDIKDRIKQKAHELYRQYGVKSVTMDEIAAQLGVSKKTIYHSFSDKNELVDEVIADMLNFNKSCCIDYQQKSSNAVHEVYLAMDVLQIIFDNMNPSILYDIERNHPVTFQKFKEFKYGFLFQAVKENIQRGKKEELYRSEINPEVVAKVRLETMMLPFNEHLFPKNKFSLVTLQQELIEYYLFGIVSQKGYKLLIKYQKERSDSNQINKNGVL